MGCDVLPYLASSSSALQQQSTAPSLIAKPSPCCSLVVARFAAPANSALIGNISNGADLTHAVYAPPSPPSLIPPSPDPYPNGRPNVTYYVQLDSTEVYMLESGLTAAVSAIAAALLFRVLPMLPKTRASLLKVFLTLLSAEQRHGFHSAI